MNRENLQNSLLSAPSDLPLAPPETVTSWGKTVVVAPHPDDESLGCGGAIALLRKFEIPVHVLCLSDGALSHPNSKTHPPEILRDLREREMLAALEILGVNAENCRFLQFPDRSVPAHENAVGWTAIIKLCAAYFRHIAPATVLVPWRRDPHPDHLAAWQIVNAVCPNLPLSPRVIEYPIWLWEIAARADAPRIGEVSAFRLDIAAVNHQKQAAIRAHRSQTTDLIADDPTAFRLTPQILANFAADWEIYLENAE